MDNAGSTIEGIEPCIEDVDTMPNQSAQDSLVVGQDVDTMPNQRVMANRRPDIDIIRVVLTWLILLYHVTIIYTPYLHYYIKDPFYFSFKATVPAGEQALGFIVWMNAWNMPLFFLLSGMSIYYAMNKRDDTTFRLERFHRLLIPALSIMALTQFFFVTLYAAKLTGICLFYREGIIDKKDSFNCLMFNKIGPNDTLGSFVRQFFRPIPGAPSPHQGWFLVYLFFYSQILAGIFYLWHPSSTNVSRCYPRKALCFFFIRTPTPEAFQNAAAFFLGGPIRLALVPSIVLAIIEVSLRQFFPDGQYWFFSVFLDLCNSLHFGFLLVVGFAMIAADGHGIKNSMERFAIVYFIIGNIILGIYVAASLDYFNVALNIKWTITVLLKGIARGFGEWIFMLGLISVLRKYIKVYPSWLSRLVEIAMPFYVMHQQILIPIAVGTLRHRVLHHFPFLLLFSTIASLLVSFAITKSGPFRYFFGLPTKPDSIIPGTRAKGLIPGILLTIIIIIEIVLANFI